MHFPKKYIFTILIILSLLCGCGKSYKFEVQMKPPQQFIEASGHFQVGAFKIDITPPPGYPMGGYALAGRFSRGWWTHLYARAIYLEDEHGRRLALVSCDLWSMPAGLVDRVTELLSDRLPASGDSAFLGREHIILAATHTHNSPANFSTSKSYNLLASPESGFDNNLFEFLARRITKAITRAIANKQPAVMKLGTVQRYGLSRNRSLEAFKKNNPSERMEIINEVPEEIAKKLFVQNKLPAVTSEEAFRAIDPNLTALVFESATNQEPIAVAAFFAVHPTAMGPHTEVYSSDIFGVATLLVEQNLRKKTVEANPVVALFNGAEGDVSPNWQHQDRENTLRIGRGLAGGILQAMQKAVRVEQTRISWRFKIVPMANQIIKEDLHNDRSQICNGDQMRTAKEPAAGVATLGGAEDGRTIFYAMGCREGYQAPVEECHPTQGRKFFSLQRLLEKLLKIDKNDLIAQIISPIINREMSKNMPDRVPLGLYTIGPVALATLPGEFTVTLGHRIKNTLKQKLHLENVLLIGLANEYLSYFTTPAEYNAQHYEGASTLYGLFSGNLIEQELATLAQLPQGTANYPQNTSYNSGPKVSKYFARIPPNDHWQPGESLENLLLNNQAEHSKSLVITFSWHSARVNLDKEKIMTERSVIPVVSVERFTPMGWQPWITKVDNSDGPFDLIESDTYSLKFVNVVESVSPDGQYLWKTLWFAPENVVREKIRFHVSTDVGESFVSVPLTIKENSQGIIEMPLVADKF